MISHLWVQMAGQAVMVTVQTSPAGSAKGFTLLELLVVMAIMGIAALIALPRLAPSPPTLEAKAAELVLKLNSHRRQTVFAGEMSVVSVDDLTREFEGYELTHEDGGSDVVFYPLGNSGGARLSLSDGQNLIAIETDWLTGLSYVQKAR